MTFQRPSPPRRSQPEAPERLSFPKSARLLKRLEFQRAYKRGRRHVDGVLALFCVQALPRKEGGRHFNQPRTRLGVCASRKIGKACQRNRAKRLVREAWRHLRPRIAPGYDVVINCRSATCRSNLDEVTEALRRVCVEAKLLPPPEPPPADDVAAPSDPAKAAPESAGKVRA